MNFVFLGMFVRLCKFLLCVEGFKELDEFYDVIKGPFILH